MSFLSRRTSRSEQRGGRAGDPRQADSEYDDYTPDGYQGDDDNWSPDEYFSPEGIKGRWAAGTRPGDRPGARPRGDEDRSYEEHDPGPQRRARSSAERYERDSYQQDSYGREDGYGANYGPGDYGPGDEYGTGAYEMVDGPDADRGERTVGRRRRTDRTDRGERRLRLGRRDKGDDIWPDDGVSDEDYWASVAADRPLTSSSPLDGEHVNVVSNRPMARPSGAGRPGGDPRPATGRPMAAESRFVAESRTGSGRLGPAPGQAGYLSTPPGTGNRPAPGPAGAYGTQPTAGPNSGPMTRAGSGPMPRAADPNSGPMARAGSGPMARPGTGPGSGPMTRAGSGPMARPGTGSSSGPMARPGTGPIPAWPTAGPGASGPYPTRSATGATPARSATGPASTWPATGGSTAAHAADEPTSTWFTTGPIPRAAAEPAPVRPSTQRPAAGLARPGLSQPSVSPPTVAQPMLNQPALPQPASAQPSFQPNGGRGSARPPEPGARTDPSARTDWADRTERIDRVTASGYPDTRTGGRSQAPAAPAASAPASVWGRDDSADQRQPAPRGPGRGSGASASPAGRHRAAADDDPLTSRRYSREELMNTDGRSYHVASRRSRLTSEQYAAALTEQTQTFSMNPQYPADPLAATGSYPVRGQQPEQQSRTSANPYETTASYPYPGQPYPSGAAPEQSEERHYRPARPGASDPAHNGNPGYPGSGYGRSGGYPPNGGYGNGR